MFCSGFFCVCFFNSDILKAECVAENRQKKIYFEDLLMSFRLLLHIYIYFQLETI